MAYLKSFFSYIQQLDKLERDKKLVILDRDYAEKMLKHISYYELINGYKKLFINPSTCKYKNNTTFEEIVALYRFDESLRELFLKYLLQIEQTMRSLLSYYFTEKHGIQQIKYLSLMNYDQNSRTVGAITKLIDTLQDIAMKSTDYTYVNHHRKKYSNVPLWVLAKVLTFGNISKMYQYFTQDLRVKISKNFYMVNEKELHQFLKVMTKFRNVCAHNDRLFSFMTKDDIPDTNLHLKLGIPRKGTQYIYGKRDLFSVVIAFRYLLQKDDFIIFKRKLGKAIDRFIAQTTHVTYNDLLHEMGFPANWKKISSYKI